MRDRFLSSVPNFRRCIAYVLHTKRHSGLGPGAKKDSCFRRLLETLTNFLFKGCEYAKPQFDHSLHFRMAFSFKPVNTCPLCTCHPYQLFIHACIKTCETTLWSRNLNWHFTSTDSNFWTWDTTFWAWNLETCETTHHRNLDENPCFKDVVFWRSNEGFMPNITRDIFSVCLDASENTSVHMRNHSLIIQFMHFPMAFLFKLVNTRLLCTCYPFY